MRSNSCMQDGTEAGSGHSIGLAPSARRRSMGGAEESPPQKWLPASQRLPMPSVSTLGQVEHSSASNEHDARLNDATDGAVDEAFTAQGRWRRCSARRATLMADYRGSAGEKVRPPSGRSTKRLLTDDREGDVTNTGVVPISDVSTAHRNAAATRLQAVARGKLARAFVLGSLTSSEQRRAVARLRSQHRNVEPGETLPHPGRRIIRERQRASEPSVVIHL